MHKKFISLFFVIFFSSQIYAVVMSKPRMMSVLSTEYFDIIFSSESSVTAEILAYYGDSLYLKAKNIVKPKHDFRIIVVISPDSEIFSVKYSASPYNRIVIYDAIPDTDYFSYKNILLDSFYSEVLSAISQSTRDTFWQIASTILGVDALQPAVLLNLPFSFIKGIASLQEENENVLNDNYNLQILMQAKSEGKFPSWIDCAGSRDIYPGDKIASAANIAFAAYLQQRFGIQKYVEFWKESGHVYFVFFTSGIFLKVYGLPLSEIWNDFVKSIPLPEENEKSKMFEEKVSNVFKNDFRSLYTNLLSTPYGLVWYDDLNHEVAIYNPKGVRSYKQLLFFASDITKISCDESGRFLAVCRKKNKNRKNLEENVTQIYDLKRRVFLSEDFKLRDSVIINLSNGIFAVGGVNIENKIPSIQVFKSEDMNEIFYNETEDEKYDDINLELVFEKKFHQTDIPFSLSRGPNGQIIFLVNHNQKSLLCINDFQNNEEMVYEINLYGENFVNQLKYGMANLMPLRNSSNFSDSNNFSLSFQYISPFEFSFAKIGYITLDSNFKIKNIALQNETVNGGVYNPAIFENDFYFCAKKYDHNELKIVSAFDVEFHRADFLIRQSEIPPYIDDLEFRISDKSAKRYNPFKYMFRGTWIPMLPVHDITMEKGAELWPGIGVTFLTESDPLENNSINLSVARRFAVLDFTNRINPTEESLAKEKTDLNNFTEDLAASVFIKNTSTFLDLSLGGFGKLNFSGQYNLKFLLGAAWSIPLGMTFSALDFDISSMLEISTFHKDFYISANENYPALYDWPSFKNAYKTLEISTSAAYSNIHQSGISPYEQRGVKVSAKIYSIWDFAEISQREKKSSDSENESGEGETKKNSLSSNFNNISPTVISFSLASEFKIPRLNPLPEYHGWIFSLPTTINLELLKDTGTAFSGGLEFLVLGKEIQKGVRFLSLYFTRAGLSFGYDLDFDYSVKRKLLPDIRSYKKFSEVFMNTYLNDKIHLKVDFVFSPVIGRLAKIGMNANFDFTYIIRSQEFQFKFGMDFKM